MKSYFGSRNPEKIGLHMAIGILGISIALSTNVGVLTKLKLLSS